MTRPRLHRFEGRDAVCPLIKNDNLIQGYTTNPSLLKKHIVGIFNERFSKIPVESKRKRETLVSINNFSILLQIIQGYDHFWRMEFNF